MTDTTKRDAVVERFYAVHYGSGYTPDPEHTIDAMADRIVELEATVERQDRILAALREPSQAVVRAVEDWIGYSLDSHAQHTIRAAVEAAEQEVDRG